MNNIFQQRWPDNIDQTTATFPAIYLHGSATWSFFYVVIVVGKKQLLMTKFLQNQKLIIFLFLNFLLIVGLTVMIRKTNKTLCPRLDYNEIVLMMIKIYNFFWGGGHIWVKADKSLRQCSHCLDLWYATCRSNITYETRMDRYVKSKRRRQKGFTLPRQ